MLFASLMLVMQNFVTQYGKMLENLAYYFWPTLRAMRREK